MGLSVPQYVPTPSELWEHYEAAVEGLSMLERRVLRIAHGRFIGRESRYFGMTPEEVSDELRAMREELDASTKLVLVAACEAILQLDFQQHKRRPARDPARTALRQLAKESDGSPTLDDLLDCWRSVASVRKVVGEFKQVVAHRHWLAHGRYWVDKCGLTVVSPEDVVLRAKAMFASLPGLADQAKLLP